MGGGCLGRVVLLAWLCLASLMALLEKYVADASAIEDLCNHAEDNFLFCVDCLKGKARIQIHDQEDIKKLAGKTITCASRSSLMVRNTMKDFSKNSTGPIQEAAKFCVPKLESAANAFNTALEFWSYQRKSDTLEYIDYGQDDYYSCVDQVPRNMFPELHLQLNCIRARGEVAYQVISAMTV